MERETKGFSQNFFRTCHVCGFVSHNFEPVDKCQKCGKCMAPFFYFNDQYVSIYADDEPRPPLVVGEYDPVRGLSAYWREED